MRSVDAEKAARRFFCRGLTDRERAAFEAGIALGSVVHQFVGLPIVGRRDEVRNVERAMERSMLAQPYRSKARVSVKLKGGPKKHPYDYVSLSPDMLRVEVWVEYGGSRVRACMKPVKQLGGYPLMYIADIK